jgi:hypothetical protein
MAKPTGEQIIQDSTTEVLARSGEAANEIMKGNAEVLTENGNASILFSNGSRAEALRGVDAFGCLCSLRARSALDGVSWVQGG